MRPTSIGGASRRPGFGRVQEHGAPLAERRRRCPAPSANLYHATGRDAAAAAAGRLSTVPAGRARDLGGGLVTSGQRRYLPRPPRPAGGRSAGRYWHRGRRQLELTAGGPADRTARSSGTLWVRGRTHRPPRHGTSPASDSTARHGTARYGTPRGGRGSGQGRRRRRPPSSHLMGAGSAVTTPAARRLRS